MKKFLCIALSVLSLAYMPSIGVGMKNYYAEESRYSLDFVQGGNYLGTHHREVYYSTKSDKEDMYVNPYKAPSFISSKPNACAVEAGGNAIVYYDRIFDELIPEYKHKYVWGGFTYGTQNDAVDNMFVTLYDMMGTDSRGTSIEGFKNGMQKYVSSRGRSINITQATGNYYGVNLDYLKTQLEAEKVAAVFLDTFSVVTFGGIEPYDGYDRIIHYAYTGQHVMLVYGYRDIYYYNANGNLKQRDTYLYVSTGYSSAALALLDITHFCNVDDVYILEVV